MADPRGFISTPQRELPPRRPVDVRIMDWREVYEETGTNAAREVLTRQAGRCMDCGIPFCHDGCPLGNLIPEWNDLVWRDDWQAAIERLHATNNFPELRGACRPCWCGCQQRAWRGWPSARSPWEQPWGQLPWARRASGPGRARCARCCARRAGRPARWVCRRRRRGRARGGPNRPATGTSLGQPGCARRWRSARPWWRGRHARHSGCRRCRPRCRRRTAVRRSSRCRC